MDTTHFSGALTDTEAPSLPSPGGTEYETPLPRSRRSSRYGTPAPTIHSSSPPPPLPPDFMNPNIDDDDDGDLLRDPKRFTPTLHASLVAEILNLRRELEGKGRMIESLETSLQGAQQECDELNEQLSDATKHNRSAKKSLQQLEESTVQALDDLAIDRDQYKKSNEDLRGKVSSLQKRVKDHEDEHNRSLCLWEKDRLDWETSKRTYERKVHVAESRLRAVIEELEAEHAARHEETEGETEDAHDSGLGNESDTASTHSIPYSPNHHRRKLSGNSLRQSQRFSGLDAQGVSLADELNFDDDDEVSISDVHESEEEILDHEERVSRARENRMSFGQDMKAKRVLGLSDEDDRPRSETPSTALGYRRAEETQYALEGIVEEQQTTGATERRENRTSRTISPAGYRRNAPSPIPTIPPRAPSRTSWASAGEKSVDVVQEVEMPLSPTRDFKGRPLSKITEILREMVDTSCQTMDWEPEPRVVIVEKHVPAPIIVEPKAETASIAVQTDRVQEEKDIRRPLSRSMTTPAPLVIPSIAIIPPKSGPPSPTGGEAVLPPQHKNVGCQAEITPNAYVSTSMQTEGIRTDERMNKLPPHLRPTALAEQLEAAEAALNRRSGEFRRSMDLRRSTSIKARESLEFNSFMSSEDRYPGNNDNGPLARPNNGKGSIRRPFRTSSLFAGFDADGDDADVEESATTERVHRSSSQKSHSGPTRGFKAMFTFNDPPTPVPEEREPVSRDGPRASNHSSRRSSPERAARVNKPAQPSLLKRRSSSMRRSALFQSGVYTHTGNESRTSSVVSVGSSATTGTHKSQPPPIPIPTRRSSKTVFPTSKSEGSQSPTPYGGTYPRRGTRTSYARQVNLRKVRSAAVIQNSPSRGDRRRSPSPPLPTEDIAMGVPSGPSSAVEARKSLMQFNSQRANHKTIGSKDDILKARTAADNSPQWRNSVMSSSHQSTVVDAIAATMIGQWMYKYVRKRKSFGVPESPTEVGRPGEDGSITISGNGVRHKRWVWLSPYERTVMWSNKQPRDNTALMGKNGRTLLIQSVLDVKDDTPPPKKEGPLFNRSIIILTPSRALKFTAPNSNSHYLWLTALSFLSHHRSQRLSPITAIPAPAPVPALDIPFLNSDAPSSPPKAKEEQAPVQTLNQNKVPFIRAPRPAPIPVPARELEVAPRPSPLLRRSPIHDSVRIAKSRASNDRPRPGRFNRQISAPLPTINTADANTNYTGSTTTLGSERAPHNGSTFFADELHHNMPSSPIGHDGTLIVDDQAASPPHVPRYVPSAQRKRASSMKKHPPLPNGIRSGSSKDSAAPASRSGGPVTMPSFLHKDPPRNTIRDQQREYEQQFAEWQNRVSIDSGSVLDAATAPPAPYILRSRTVNQSYHTPTSPTSPGFAAAGPYSAPPVQVHNYASVGMSSRSAAASETWSDFSGPRTPTLHMPASPTTTISTTMGSKASSEQKHEQRFEHRFDAFNPRPSLPHAHTHPREPSRAAPAPPPVPAKDREQEQYYNEQYRHILSQRMPGVGRRRTMVKAGDGF